MTHPLTDEMIEDIWNKTSSSMVNMEDPIDTQVIRAAADWQLEQVIKWAQKNCWCWFEKSNNAKSFTEELKKAMRPQEDN